MQVTKKITTTTNKTKYFNWKLTKFVTWPELNFHSISLSALDNRSLTSFSNSSLYSSNKKRCFLSFYSTTKYPPSAFQCCKLSFVNPFLDRRRQNPELEPKMAKQNKNSKITKQSEHLRRLQQKRMRFFLIEMLTLSKQIHLISRKWRNCTFVVYACMCLTIWPQTEHWPGRNSRKLTHISELGIGVLYYWKQFL